MLEDQSKSLFETINKLEKEQAAQTDQLRQSLTVSINQLETADKALQDKLEKAIIGGISIEWWGVALFSVGIVLASASPEIVSFLEFLGTIV